MTPNTKEWIQYGSAIIMIASGIILAFLSFFFNHFSISDSVLWYIAQALMYAGGIFGIAIYFKNKSTETENRGIQFTEKLINIVIDEINNRVNNIKTNSNENKC